MEGIDPNPFVIDLSDPEQVKKRDNAIAIYLGALAVEICKNEMTRHQTSTAIVKVAERILDPNGTGINTELGADNAAD